MIALHFSEYSFYLAQALSDDNEVLLCINERNLKNEISLATLARKTPRCRIVRLPDVWLRKPRLFLGGIRALTEEIQGFNPDVIHCQEAVRDYLLPALYILRRHPLILTIHDHVAHSGMDAQASIRVKFYRWWLRQRATRVIVHGTWIKGECERIFPWLKGRISAIPHGLLGTPDKPPIPRWNNGTLLFFGRIQEYKGLRYLIEATHLLEGEGIISKVIIAGTGQDLTKYRDIVSSHAIYELIERYIEIEEIPTIFNQSDIVVLPYTDGTQSGVAALAINYRRPIIASDVGSIGEMVRNGFNGLLVPKRDADALANAIKTLLKDHPLLQKMSDGAAWLATNELSWKSIAKKTQAVYEIALQTTSGASRFSQDV